MHLITGFILASLFGKKKKRNIPPLLRLRYPIQTKHLMKGRVRFQIDALKGNTKSQQYLLEQLPRVQGVTSIQVNIITGSVLIHFDEKEMQPELLYTVLIRLLGLEDELDKVPESVILREIRLIGKSLNRAMFERTAGVIDLQTAIPVVLGIIGIRKIMSQKMLAFPTGFTMLWWAYQSLVRGKR